MSRLSYFSPDSFSFIMIPAVVWLVLMMHTPSAILNIFSIALLYHIIYLYTECRNKICAFFAVRRFLAFFTGTSGTSVY
jgi:hypothetical protein